MLPQEATRSFPSLLGAIYEGRCSGTEDGAGNPNAPRDGPCWAWEQEQTGGSTAGSGGEGRNLQDLLDSESTCSFTAQVRVRMAWFPHNHFFKSHFYP